MNPKPQKEKQKPFVRVGECLYRCTHNGVYYFQGQINGQKFTRSLHTTDRKTANRKLAEKRDQLGQQDHAAGKMSLAALCERYRETYQTQSDKTIEEKDRILDRILDDWPTGKLTPIGKIHPSDCRLFLAGLHKLGASSRNAYLWLLKDIFKMAVDDKALLQSPAHDLKPEKRKDPERLTPTFEEFEAIVASVRAPKSNHHHNGSRITVQNGAEDSADFLEAQGRLGLGQAEISNLTRQDVKFETQQISVRRRKTSKRFVIPIFPGARSLLERVCKGKRHNQHLFAINNARKALAGACDRLGLPPFSQRSFRRMFVTRAIERGVDVKVIAEWQGHQDGGALILKTYSEVRQPHSQRMAQLMT